MVFIRALTLIALPLLAVATAIQGRGASPGDSCCSSVSSASDPTTATILADLGIDAGSINGLVGLGCSPITVVQLAAGGCGDTTTVTCTDNSHATIGLGCVPVTL